MNMCSCKASESNLCVKVGFFAVDVVVVFFFLVVDGGVGGGRGGLMHNYLMCHVQGHPG